MEKENSVKSKAKDLVHRIVTPVYFWSMTKYGLKKEVARSVSIRVTHLEVNNKDRCRRLDEKIKQHDKDKGN